MNAYEVLRDVHHLGSRISGTVLTREEPVIKHGVPFGNLAIKTDSAYPALLGYSALVDHPSMFSPMIIPEVGARIDAVVVNFVDGTLYLSARPSDLKESSVLRYQQYYDYIGTLTVGYVVPGVVKQSVAFGLFVDIGGPFIGLIDIGHTSFNGGDPLPRDRSKWPAVGDEIYCVISYFRFSNQQIGLGWAHVLGG